MFNLNPTPTLMFYCYFILYESLLKLFIQFTYILNLSFKDFICLHVYSSMSYLNPFFLVIIFLVNEYSIKYLN